MEETKKRLCTYTAYITIPDEEKEDAHDLGNKIESGEGWFHRWADDLQADSKMNLGQITVAVVEDRETGKVYTVNPNDIKFII